jgi:hypothetical protein
MFERTRKMFFHTPPSHGVVPAKTPPTSAAKRSDVHLPPQTVPQGPLRRSSCDSATPSQQCGVTGNHPDWMGAIRVARRSAPGHSLVTGFAAEHRLVSTPPSGQTLMTTSRSGSNRVISCASVAKPPQTGGSEASASANLVVTRWSRQQQTRSKNDGKRRDVQVAFPQVRRTFWLGMGIAGKADFGFRSQWVHTLGGSSPPARTASDLRERDFTCVTQPPAGAPVDTGAASEPGGSASGPRATPASAL